MRYAENLRTIGTCFAQIKQQDSALHYLNECLKVLVKQNREVHLEFAQTLEDLSFIYNRKSEYKNAEIYALKALYIRKKILGENNYREVEDLRSELAYRRRLIAKLESDGTSEERRIQKLRSEADSLDKRLTLSWPEYAQQKKNLFINWNQIQQNLDTTEAAIEFIRFKSEKDSQYYYNALILKRRDSIPKLVPLCPEKFIQNINPKLGYSSHYTLLWKSFESYLIDIKTIYYAPSGELLNVPFHAIYAPIGAGDQILAVSTNKRGVVISDEKAVAEPNAE